MPDNLSEEQKINVQRQMMEDLIANAIKDMAICQILSKLVSQMEEIKNVLKEIKEVIHG